MNLYKLLLIGNVAIVVTFIILERKIITVDLIPLLAFSLATSISSSPRILGISLIIGSSILIYSLVLPFEIAIISLSLLSLKINKVKFAVLPLSFSLLFFHFPFILYFFVVLGSVLLLLDKIQDPRPLFSIALPYFITQLIFLFSIVIISGFSRFLFSEIAFNSKMILPSVIVLLLAIFRKELLESKNFYVGLASLLLAIPFLIIYPLYALAYSSSSAIVINNMPSEKDLESLVLKGNDEILRSILQRYEDLTPIYCRLVDQGNCEAVVKIPTLAPYKINYALCDIRKIAECFEKLQKVPPVDIINFLLVAREKDIELAERIGELARRIAPSPKLLRILDEIEILKMENLKQNWDPKLWINREVYGYKITNYLGKGGFAYVLVGEKGGKKYAVKIPILFPPSSAIDSYYAFINEYSQLRELSLLSNEIVKFVDSKVDIQAIRKIVNEKDVLTYLNEPPIIVMEYMEGGSAKELIYNDNVFYSDEWKKIVLLIGLYISKALTEIHEAGYVHLDVKPSNILFSRSPGKTGKEVWNNLNSFVQVKLSDLGSARKIGERVSQYTPEYCPIDQIEAIVGLRGAHPSMDIYSLGATLYKMLTRKDYNPPELIKIFNDVIIIYEQKGDVKEMINKAKEIYLEYYKTLTIPDVEDDIVSLIKAMTNPKPEERPTAKEVYNRLKELLNRYERGGGSR